MSAQQASSPSSLAALQALILQSLFCVSSSRLKQSCHTTTNMEDNKVDTSATAAHRRLLLLVLMLRPIHDVQHCHGGRFIMPLCNASDSGKVVPSRRQHVTMISAGRYRQSTIYSNEHQKMPCPSPTTSRNLTVMTWMRDMIDACADALMTRSSPTHRLMGQCQRRPF